MILKTSRSGANPRDFAKAVANFTYHLQAKHYLNGIPSAKRFIFLVVQSEYPFDVGLWELDDDALKEGQKLSREALDKIAECRLLDDWPSWCQTGVQSLSLPRWAFFNPLRKMSFTEKQVELLQQPIDKKNVETRDGNKRWHVSTILCRRMARYKRGQSYIRF